MIIHKCDRCGEESKQERGTMPSKPDGWFELSYRTTRYGQAHQTFELCPKCKAALKIPDEVKDSSAVGEQLIELIEEIVIERMEDGI